MISIFRYRTSKPSDGHFSFELHGGASILSFSEHWHTEKGWEVFVDALVDTSIPRRRMWFFLCTGGDNLDFLGDQAPLYHLGTHEHKAYVSYLFDTTHLSENERAKGKAEATRLRRAKPPVADLSRTQRGKVDRQLRAVE